MKKVETASELVHLLRPGLCDLDRKAGVESDVSAAAGGDGVIIRVGNASSKIDLADWNDATKSRKLQMDRIKADLFGV